MTSINVYSTVLICTIVFSVLTGPTTTAAETAVRKADVGIHALRAPTHKPGHWVIAQSANQKPAQKQKPTKKRKDRDFKKVDAEAVEGVAKTLIGSQKPTKASKRRRQ